MRADGDFAQGRPSSALRVDGRRALRAEALLSASERLKLEEGVDQPLLVCCCDPAGRVVLVDVAVMVGVGVVVVVANAIARVGVGALIAQQMNQSQENDVGPEIPCEPT